MFILNEKKSYWKKKKDVDEEAMKQKINYLLIRLC